MLKKTTSCAKTTYMRALLTGSSPEKNLSKNRVSTQTLPQTDSWIPASTCTNSINDQFFRNIYGLTPVESIQP